MTNILVVDDSDVDCLLFKTFAERIPGCTVIQAENGEQALEQIDKWGIELIVTDLIMPKMDGLELLKAVRKQYPTIPVILATGKGSDEIAAEALELGAVGYVPKSRLEKLLVPTIQSALSNLKLDQGCAGLMASAEMVRLRFSLKNVSTEFPKLVNCCSMMLEGISPLDSIGRMRVGVAIEQALHNAMYRGNLEIASEIAIPFGDESPLRELTDRVASRLADPVYNQRKITVDISIDRKGFCCCVKDDGPGFDADLSPRSLSADNGRGLMLIITFMDDVKVNESGNEITFRLNWKPLKKMGADGTLDDSVSHQSSEQVDKPSSPTNFGQLISKQSGRTIHIDRNEFVVGRSNTCHMVLTNKNVSKHHCMLILSKGEWYVKDLYSENGVTVNGKKVMRARLLTGDVLGVAHLQYEIRYDSDMILSMSRD